MPAVAQGPVAIGDRPGQIEAEVDDRLVGGALDDAQLGDARHPLSERREVGEVGDDAIDGRGDFTLAEPPRLGAIGCGALERDAVDGLDGLPGGGVERGRNRLRQLREEVERHACRQGEHARTLADYGRGPQPGTCVVW